MRVTLKQPQAPAPVGIPASGGLPEGAMAKASSFGFEISSYLDGAASQFRNLNPNEPGQWPLMPKAAAWLLTAAGC